MLMAVGWKTHCHHHHRQPRECVSVKKKASQIHSTNANEMGNDNERQAARVLQDSSQVLLSTFGQALSVHEESSNALSLAACCSLRCGRKGGGSLYLGPMYT